MVHIQDLIENLDPCRSSFQSSVHSHLIKPLFEASIHPNMRIQCNLLPLFLLGLVVIASIVEASGKKKKKKEERERKKSTSPSTSIFHDDTSETGNEVLVPQVPKTSDSSSLLPVGSSSVQINGIPSVLSQLPHTTFFFLF